jgi:hypothetical protein
MIPKIFRKLEREASDPATDPTRLKDLAGHHFAAVSSAAKKNPSLLMEDLRTFLLEGKPDAWDNPMAPLLLLAWTPLPSDNYETLEVSSARCIYELIQNPNVVSAEAKELISAKTIEWWNSNQAPLQMFSYLSWWYKRPFRGEELRRKVVHVYVLFAKTIPNLSAEERSFLERMETWSDGRVQKFPSSIVGSIRQEMQSIVNFAQGKSPTAGDLSHYVCSVVAEHLNDPNEYLDVYIEHEQRLLEIFRREIPVPPLANELVG